jgi:hypothetical protein
MATASISREIRVFGPPTGAAGVRVIEQVGTGNLQTPTQAPIVVIGPFKRGPSGRPIFCSSRKQYNEIFGDKREPRWHLYPDAEFYTPDVVDGYYTMAGDNAPLWVIRLDLEGKGKAAKKVLTNAAGTPVLELSAGNEGRWGGAAQKIPQATLIVVTSSDFTIYAPDVRANEFAGAKAYFKDVTGSQGFEIVANTAPFENGEVIFSVSSQYDLLSSGIYGPVTLSGRGTYTLTVPVPGTIASPTNRDIRGTATANETVIMGTGTNFLTELQVDQNVYFQDEARVVRSISSNTTATIDAPFTGILEDGTLQVDNLEVFGTGTPFDQTIVGRQLSVNLEGQTYTRTIAAVTSPTQLTLSSGYPINVPPGTAATIDNYWVTGSADSNFGAELKPGNKIIDPSRRGEGVTVTEVDTVSIPNRFKVSKAFSGAFNNVQLTKQTQGVEIQMPAASNEGLSVEVGLGQRFPQTHFSLKVFFNSSLVVNVPDASLDPKDPYYIEPLVNDGNIAYRTGGQSYQAYVSAKNLWNSAYTTAPTNDVRPFNGAGEMLQVTPRRIYTVAKFDYSRARGAMLNIAPYSKTSAIVMDTVRIVDTAAPLPLEGSVSTNGINVIGTDTTFKSSLKKGDYLYDVRTNTARRIRFVASDRQLILDTAFPANLPALSQVTRAGYLQTEEGVDMTLFSKKGDKFIIPFQEAFGGGYDGDLGTIRPYYYSKFLNPDNDIIERSLWGTGAGMWRTITPGVTISSVLKMGALYASRTASEFRCEIPPHYSPAAAKAFINEEVGLSEFMTCAYPSYGYITDPLRNGQRLVPISGDIMGLETFYCRTYQGWHVPAAGVEARLSRVNELTYQVSSIEEAELNNIGIQPIKKMYGSAVIFGVESPAIDEIYKFIHVRRTENEMARQFLEALPFMRRLFKPNQPQTAEQLRMTLDDYMLSKYTDGWFNQFLMYEQCVQIVIETPVSTTASSVDETSRERIADIAAGNLTAVINWYPAGVLKNLFFRISPDIVTASYGG